MDHTTIYLGILTLTLLTVSLQAWRLGQERRDVALLGAMGGGCGVGTALSVVL